VGKSDERKTILDRATARDKVLDKMQMRLTVDEAAVLAQVSPRVVRKWCERHGIGTMFGRDWVVDGIALLSLGSDSGS
jgi:hypothetical protein